MPARPSLRLRSDSPTTTTAESSCRSFSSAATTAAWLWSPTISGSDRRRGCCYLGTRLAPQVDMLPGTKHTKQGTFWQQATAIAAGIAIHHELASSKEAQMFKRIQSSTLQSSMLHTYDVPHTAVHSIEQTGQFATSTRRRCSVRSCRAACRAGPSSGARRRRRCHTGAPSTPTSPRTPRTGRSSPWLAPSPPPDPSLPLSPRRDPLKPRSKKKRCGDRGRRGGCHRHCLGLGAAEAVAEALGAEVARGRGAEEAAVVGAGEWVLRILAPLLLHRFGRGGGGWELGGACLRTRAFGHGFGRDRAGREGVRRGERRGLMRRDEERAARVC
ncbi:hypothetical protein C2845_PM11G15760 [Panicum miliaceum]|uniref:Uncharacterized protein n=1 Tax=Panicum miliaceum TaxID=4540 RepID=A0A3L6RXK2_PANMI|nr:hypothetical protein C2845_PM11G15760 [Panicum miliaceum]